MSRKIRRYDLDGRDLTDLPGLWSMTDCEILQTQYKNPEQTTGMKVNGPPLIFIRLPDCGDYRREWMRCEEKSIHKVLQKWYSEGFEGFWVQA